MAAIGLARPFPAMSGADPWTGSKNPGNDLSLGLKLAPGANPMPPVTEAVKSERISAKRLEATITSYPFGFLTTSIQAASMSLDSVRISGYSAEISLKILSQRTIPYRWALDLVTE